MKNDPKDAIWLDAQHIKDGPETPSEAITDLLADIRHYCDTHDLNFAELDHVAYGHYLDEKGAQDGEKMQMHLSDEGWVAR
jgi:hypothetical protein